MKILDILRQSYYNYQMRLRFKLYGLSAIKTFADLAKKSNLEYSLAFGTLLGAYRDKGFIKNDDDIDIIVNRNRINLSFVRQMLDNGFKLKGIYMSQDRELVHVSFKYHEITFDIYGFNINYHDGDSVIFAPNPPKGYDWNESAKQNLYQVCRVHFNYVGTSMINFKGIPCYILSNAKEFLSVIYGDDFMIPMQKKGFSSPNYEFVSLDKMKAYRVGMDALDN